MKSLTEKYNAVLEGRYEKFHFLRDVRMSHPDLITQFNGFEDTVQILKNKGMISEVYPGPVVTMNTIPLEALERGVDVELEEMGLDSVEVPTPEDHKKASDKALKNLEKNVLHYLEKLADVKPETKRTDVMKDVTKDNVVDTDNGLKKVELNEMAVAKDLIKNLIKKALNEEIETNDVNQHKQAVTEALNKDIRQFAKDLGKYLTNDGFKVKYVEGSNIPDEAYQQLRTETGLAAFVLNQNEDQQSLYLYFNPKEKSKIEKVIDKFQLTPYSGKPMTAGWTSKQVVGALNPGDIFKTDGGQGMYQFFRLKKVDTKVVDANEAAEEDQPTEEPTQANAQSDRERKIKVRNALDATLGTLEGRVNLEDLADPKVLDMYLDNLRDEIQSRTQMEDLTQPNLQEAQPRKRFTYEGTIV